MLAAVSAALGLDGVLMMRATCRALALAARCALLRVADTHTDTVTHTHTHTHTGGGGGASRRLSTAASAGTPRPDEALRETCASTRELRTT